MTNHDSKLTGVQNPNLIMAASSIGMMVSSIYLYWHYFAIRFPTTLVSSSFCEVNSFISCNAVSYSPISAFFGVPISIFGFLNGLFFLYGTFNYSLDRERLNKLLSTLNFAGCLILFLVSLFFLKHLCPVCTLYYIFSGVCWFLYFKYADKFALPLKLSSIYIAITCIFLLSSFLHGNSERKSMLENKDVFVEDYYTYPNLGVPRIESPYRIYSSTKNFQDAAIQITIFSDFQCPACSYFAKLINQIIGRYSGKLNIQFFFFPLDASCNSDSGMVHPLACKSSYLAACLPEKFHKVHDDIFEQAQTISPQWLDDYAKKNNVYECMNDMKTKEEVVKLINIGKDFNINATPTMILNGVKVEGVLPIQQLIILMDEIVKRHNDKK